MIDTLSNKEGYVVGYIEWHIKVNNEAETEGWIENIWIHPLYRSYKHLMLLCRTIRKKCPQAKEVSWERYKYNKRQSNYKIENVLHEGG